MTRTASFRRSWCAVARRRPADALIRILSGLALVAGAISCVSVDPDTTTPASAYPPSLQGPATIPPTVPGTTPQQSPRESAQASPRPSPPTTPLVSSPPPTASPRTTVPPTAGPPLGGEPPGFEHYHTYAEIDVFLDSVVAAHPNIARRFSIGTSFEGRSIMALKISRNVMADETEPEVFVNAGMHGRERVAIEMAVYIIELLTSEYGVDDEITSIIDATEIFVVPMMNPDGAEFDLSNGRFHRWRKNRQPIPNSSEIGVDLNRQFGFKWACCDGSSANPGNEQYRGPEPWFAPEVRAYRDFVDSRVVGGRQQITTIISWHSAGRMVLWPYFFTDEDVPAEMRVDDHAAFVALGTQAAALNGYRAQQGSDLYIVDGDQDDWAYHQHRIFAFKIEMAKANGRYYPTVTELEADVERNRPALLLLLDYADCPHRAINREQEYCPRYERASAATGDGHLEHRLAGPTRRQRS